jgi:hypothetical protein
MVKPKLIIEVAVRSQAMSVRSCASQVRPKANWVLSVPLTPPLISKIRI